MSLGLTAQKKGGSMDVIQESTEEVFELDSLNCCWPPGTILLESPEED